MSVCVAVRSCMYMAVCVCLHGCTGAWLCMCARSVVGYVCVWLLGVGCAEVPRVSNLKDAPRSERAADRHLALQGPRAGLR